MEISNKVYANKWLHLGGLLFSGLALIMLIYDTAVSPVNAQLNTFALLFSAITVGLLLSSRETMVRYSPYYLLSTFSMIVAWRLCGLGNLTAEVYLFLVAMIFKLFLFIDVAYRDVRVCSSHSTWGILLRHEWQLIFVRMLIGFILIPHFSEKLLAGDAMRHHDVVAFASMGVTYPTVMVFVAGLCELGGAFAISCGYLTRLGAICLSIYLLVATYIGGHFENTYIWASQGGGWEYPVMWACLVFSFVLFGAGKFSLDAVLRQRYKVPCWVQCLMGGSVD